MRQLDNVWQVVVDLEAMNREVQRLAGDLRHLYGPGRVRSLANAATDLDVAAGDLRRALSEPIDKSKIGSYLNLIRRQSADVADEVRVAAPTMSSAQKLIGARYRTLGNSIAELPADLSTVQPGGAEWQQAQMALREQAQMTMQVGTEIHEIRIRAHLAKVNAVLIVDGDNVAADGWPDLSVIARRNALLALLAAGRHRAHIAVMLEWAVGGPYEVSPTDGIQVLLANQEADLAHALLSLIATQSAESSVVVVTDHTEVVNLAKRLHPDVSAASSLALRRLLNSI